MLSRFLEQVAAKGLLDPQKVTLVGYSGGPDSTCLLHLLQGGGFDVVAAHLHHGQRKEADHELGRCEAFCSELGVPFLSGRADVPKLAAALKVGVEEAGRIARYRFFEAAASSVTASAIATAHTRDDQVETVLLNLVRGAGLAGLAGIPERRGNIVRPLLEFSRIETRAYCEQHGLWTHDDPANVDTAFSRARIRHRIVPELAQINQQYVEAITKLSEIARSEDEFLNGMAAAALEKCELLPNGDLSFLTADNEVYFNREILVHLPNVLLRRALRLMAATVGGELDYRKTCAAEQAIRKGKPGSVTCEGGDVVLSWDVKEIGSRQLAKTRAFRENLMVPGETISDDMNWSIEAHFDEMPSGDLSRTSLCSYIPESGAKGALYVRNWKPGDQMRPLGFGGHRKLSDLISERGLTMNGRACLPVLCDLVGALWVPGVCIEERCRAKPGERVVRVSFGPVQ